MSIPESSGYICYEKRLPDVRFHNPDPEYLRYLLKKANLTQKQAAELLGINLRTMQIYLSARDAVRHIDIPYTVQYALECLAFAILTKCDN